LSALAHHILFLGLKMAHIFSQLNNEKIFILLLFLQLKKAQIQQAFKN
jgi:hypothetical protein